MFFSNLMSILIIWLLSDKLSSFRDAIIVEYHVWRGDHYNMWSGYCSFKFRRMISLTDGIQKKQSVHLRLFSGSNQNSVTYFSDLFMPFMDRGFEVLGLLSLHNCCRTSSSFRLATCKLHFIFISEKSPRCVIPFSLVSKLFFCFYY